jgi:hypothetical protein
MGRGSNEVERNLHVSLIVLCVCVCRSVSTRLWVVCFTVPQLMAGLEGEGGKGATHCPHRLFPPFHIPSNQSRHPLP